MWASIVLSALVFSYGHIYLGKSVALWRPVYLQLILDPRTYVGIVLAWIYWNRGIETSIVAHSTTNLVVHAFVVMVRKV